MPDREHQLFSIAGDALERVLSDTSLEVLVCRLDDMLAVALRGALAVSIPAGRRIRRSADDWRDFASEHQYACRDGEEWASP
jgi:hypothetical protein